MKFKILFLAVAVATIGFAFKTTGVYSNLKIGQVAPMAGLKMNDVKGNQTSLQDAKGKNGLLVMFSCNTCPFVIGNGEKSQGWENRYNGIVKNAAKAGIGTILINSNEAKRDKGDSYDDMVKRATSMLYNGAYALDKGHVLADAFGAKTTPHVFLFDADLKLTYQGAIDDNVDSKQKVKVHYLTDAINAMSKGADVAIKETKPVGCSIKRTTVAK